MLARTGCTDTYEEYFLRGTAPNLCTQHSGSKVSNNISNDNSQSTGVYKDDDKELELDPDDEEEVQVVNKVIGVTVNEVGTNRNEVEETPVNNTIDNSDEEDVTPAIDENEGETVNDDNDNEENTVLDVTTNTVSSGKRYNRYNRHNVLKNRKRKIVQNSVE